MKALILINAYAPTTDTRQVVRLRDELNKLGVQVVVKRNDGFFASVENGRTQVSADYDFCVYLDKDKYISRLLESKMRLFNSAQAIELCDDKMTTHIALADKGILMPDTIPGALCYTPNAKIDEERLKEVEDRLGLPLVVKQSFGSLGKGVYLASSHDELVKIVNEIKLTPHLFQRFIGSSAGRDMRVIVVGGTVLGGIIRQSDGDFRSNVGLGGHAHATEVPTDIQRTAVRAAAALGLDYCGMDFLLGDTPMLCEVNSNAYFDAFESATGINVAAAYARHIIKEMER